MTNQQGAPEALRLAESLERRTTSWTDKCFAAFELRRLHAENERLAALVEAQQPTTHVPNPAEIEHVAGDVSKTGAEANTRAQQPTQALAGAVPLTCEWAHNENDGFWESACGEAWRFDDGGPAENSMHFCHSCGKSLRIKGKEAGNAE